MSHRGRGLEEDWEEEGNLEKKSGNVKKSCLKPIYFSLNFVNANFNVKTHVSLLPAFSILLFTQ